MALKFAQSRRRLLRVEIADDGPAPGSSVLVRRPDRLRCIRPPACWRRRPLWARVCARGSYVHAVLGTSGVTRRVCHRDVCSPNFSQADT
jgi:hypothetical protein